MTCNDFPRILQPIYEYFFDVYISEYSAVFPVDLWHCLENIFCNIPKTNNAIEAWHNNFNSSFGTSKFNFALLIQKLKDEEEIIRQRVLRINNGESFRRAKRYVEMENNLKIFVENSPVKFRIDYVMNIVNLFFY
jgi:hypothetical protein